ncbi:hypothetical protein C8046_13865 [Serinibacter arcticus]|uniref:Uncharacterized protein n=1 Tax=Serinibacter arcticus TaxID=1655435 RepID=A0A2U1ZX45_9MICO|nr:hypothetical protein [Serinibacter arcticus]PWD51566.1 hypothetical protein C8046_13865 [Serinibacter arcticus]
MTDAQGRTGPQDRIEPHDAMEPRDELDRVDDVAGGHLDLPLVRTVRLTALERQASRAAAAQLRRDAVAGRVPGAERLLKEEGRAGPARVGLIMGGAAFGLFLVGALLQAFTSDSGDLSFGLAAAAVFGVLMGGVGYLGLGIARGRRWRRHATVAAFAADNGLHHVLRGRSGRLPRAVGSRLGSHERVVHHDVVTGRVAGRRLRLGHRALDVRVGSDATSTRHLMWIALEVLPGTAPPSPVMRNRIEGILGRGTVVIDQDGEWLVLGVEDRRGSLARIGDLVAAMDLVLSEDV